MFSRARTDHNGLQLLYVLQRLLTPAFRFIVCTKQYSPKTNMPLVRKSGGSDTTWDPLAGKVQAPRKQQGKRSSKKAPAPVSYTPQFRAGSGGRAPRGYSSQPYYGNSRLPGHGVSGFPVGGMPSDFGAQWRLISDNFINKLEGTLSKFASQNHNNKENISNFNQNSNKGPFGEVIHTNGPFTEDSGPKRMEEIDTRLDQLKAMPKAVFETHINKVAEGLEKLDLTRETPMDTSSLNNPSVGPTGRHAEVHEPAPNADWRVVQYRPPKSGNDYATMNARTQPPMGSNYVFGVVGNASAGTTAQHGGGRTAAFATHTTQREAEGPIEYDYNYTHRDVLFANPTRNEGSGMPPADHNEQQRRWRHDWYFTEHEVNRNMRDNPMYFAEVRQKYENYDTARKQRMWDTAFMHAELNRAFADRNVQEVDLNRVNIIEP